MAVLTMGAAIEPSLYLTAISVALMVAPGTWTGNGSLGLLVAVDDDPAAVLEPFRDVDPVDQGGIDHDHVVGKVDAALVVDLAAVDAEEGHDR